MANKRSVKRELWQLNHVKTWQLVVVLILFAFVSATLLRLNNVGMIERRDAVNQADAEGDQHAAADHLYDLQRYSAKHMNADTGEIYLDTLYTLKVEEVTKEAEKANEQSSQKSAELLREAYETCKNRYPGYSQAYTLCVGEEQAKIPANTIGVTKIKFPEPALYRHSFISPVWSPDYAGWAVVLTLLIGVAVVVRFLLGVYLRWQLRRHYRSV